MSIFGKKTSIDNKRQCTIYIYIYIYSSIPSNRRRQRRPSISKRPFCPIYEELNGHGPL